MRTFEYRLYPTKQQAQLLMQCLAESRILYNQMGEMVKTQYAEQGTFPSKEELEQAFKGQGEHVPATTIQMLADRLTKALQRFLAVKKLGQNVGFPRFKPVERWLALFVCWKGIRIAPLARRSTWAQTGSAGLCARSSGASLLLVSSSQTSLQALETTPSMKVGGES